MIVREPNTFQLFKSMGGAILIALYIRGVRRFAEFTYLATLPAMMISLHTTRGNLQITMLAFIVGILVMQLSSVIVNRYISMYQHLLCSAIALIVGCVIIVSSNSISMITIGRFCEGLGAGILFSISNSFIYDKAKSHFSTDYQSVTERSLAFVGSFSAWIPSIAIIIGGALLITFSWHSTFYLVIALAFILLLFAIKLYKQNMSHQINTSTQSILKAYQQILSNKSYLLLTLSFSLCSAGITSYFIMIFFLFPHYNTSTIGHVSLFALAPAFGHFLGKLLSTKNWNFKNLLTPLRIGYSLSFISSVIFTSLILTHHDHLSLFIIQIIIFSIGAGIATPNTLGIILYHFKQLKVLANALFYAISSLFAILSIWLIVHLHLNSPLSLALIFLIYATVALILILISRVSSDDMK